MIEPLRRFLRLLWRALHQFNADHGPNHAAAVAYFSLLSLPPFMLLAARLIGYFLPGTAGTEATLAAVASFLPPEIAPALGTVGESLAHPNALVAIAVPVLLWVASHAFSSLEVAVNVAFGTTPQRRFWLSRLKAFAGLSGGVVLLGATVTAGHIASWLDGYYTRTGAPPALSPRAHFASALGLIGLTLGVFTLFYKLLPRGKVAWSAALQAGTIAVILWEGARQFFGRLIVTSPTFGLLSGALAGMVAFLGWIYVAVVIIIYGAEVAALLDGKRTPVAPVRARSRR
jgi:membrane protein